MCVLIDELIGTQEIVVKPIPSYVKKVHGISGCTQLGDSSIALILDVGGLMQDQEAEMTQQDKDLLEQNGFDVQGALHRFINNDTLYQQLSLIHI